MDALSLLARLPLAAFPPRPGGPALIRRLLLILLAAGAALAQPPHHHHRFGDVQWSVSQFENADRDRWQQPDKVVESLHLRKGMVVADLGAGTGYFSRRLARAVAPSGQVLALEVEPKLVDYMRERARREGQANLVPRLIGFTDPGLAPHSVDLILIVDTWHHIDHRQAYLPKLKRALKRGGRLAIVDFRPTSPFGPPAHMRIDRMDLVGELTRGGFVVSEDLDYLPNQYFLVFKPE